MAIRENDREDLLRDAVNLPNRGQAVIRDAQVVVGFRAAKQASFFFGSDPVFQFNAAKQLRRAYFGGERLAARDGQLMRLAKQSSGGRLQLLETPLTEDEQASALKVLQKWLDETERSFCSDASSWQVCEESPGQFLGLARQWFDELDGHVDIADTPNA